MASKGIKRITTELAAFTKKPEDGIIIETDPANVLQWNVLLSGPVWFFFYFLKLYG